MVWLFSIKNCTAMFFACMSVISRSRLVSRIIVGAKTTAKFEGVIYMVLVETVEARKRGLRGHSMFDIPCSDPCGLLHAPGGTSRIPSNHGAWEGGS